MMDSTSSSDWGYDVFISYRGEDIGKTFMDHLFSNLKRKGIHTYGDKNQLTREEEEEEEKETSSKSYNAIEQSRFLIIIFSQNYASSTLCLKQLAKILECKEREKNKYELRCIFYDVKPSVVRYQTATYKHAIMKHESNHETEVLKWKQALTLAANLSGWDLHDMTNGHEPNFIDLISKEIFYKLIDGPTHVSNNLVGLYARAEQMNLLQFVDSDKVHMIGICGIGGIGKTTVAKAVYNLLYKHFEGHSFCEDVKNVVNQNGIVYLQTKLLDDVMEGRGLKRTQLQARKVLIVLDDVDCYNQLEAVVGNPNCFGNGSMIVVTTRDRQLLKAYQVEHIYEIDILSNDEALELFCMYAFKEKHPPYEFVEHANRIVEYVSGLPLGLKTYGRILYNKSLLEWEKEINKLERTPHFVIMEVLRVSYDALDDDQKRIFLDIACFFKGEKKDYVMKMLDGRDSESYMATNLKVLEDKSLISICEGRIHMHNLVQKMGWEIVNEECEEIGKRSRLWCPRDVCDVLENDKGSDLIKGLALDISCSQVNIFGQSFTKLTNLRLLYIYMGDLSKYEDTNLTKFKNDMSKKTISISGNFEYLSSELQLLCWHGYPFQKLPKTFYPESLVFLDMSYSCIKQIWSVGSKGFENLTVLKLSHCLNIRYTPDFTKTPNLKELILNGCENLVEIHPSIGSLKMLVFLNLKNCKNLEISPKLTELISLQHLILSGCSKLETKSWNSLFSIWRYLKKSHPLAFLSNLSSLRILDVSYCNLSGRGLSNLESLDSLEELNLSGNDFTSIDVDFSQLSHLSCLRLVDCKKLKIVPKLPSSILKLDVND
ncbi:hypothetical protein LXL04_035765 [Taraxacum kok-saghyz]